MSVKLVVTAKAETRKEFKSGKYLRYGQDDYYPQRLIELAASSATLSMALDKRAKFIEGNGFEDEQFYKAQINRRGHTLDELLKKVASDQSQFEGHAIHIQYNGLLEISAATHIPFENCRVGEPDDLDYISKIYVVRKFDAFQRSIRSRQQKEQCYDVFNPNKLVLAQQIEKAGGIENYPGQILYAFRDRPGARFYPRPAYDAVLMQTETEAAIIKSLNRDVKRGFSLRHIITKMGYETAPTEKEKKEDREDYGSLIGEEGSTVIIEYAATKDSAPVVTKIEAPDLDKLYTFSSVKVKDDILHTIGIPQLLYGIQTAGKLGTADEFQDATNYVTRFVVNQDQRLIERSFKAIFEKFTESSAGKINPSEDYSIQNLTVDQAMQMAGAEGGAVPSGAEDLVAKAQAELRGSVGGVTSLLAIQQSVSQGTTTYESGVAMLINIYGYDEKIATSMLGDAEAIKQAQEEKRAREQELLKEQQKNGSNPPNQQNGNK